MTDRLGPGHKIVQTFDIRIIEKIAEGGMGEVYEAVLHGASGFEKRIALKIIRADLVGAGAAEELIMHSGDGPGQSDHGAGHSGHGVGLSGHGAGHSSSETEIARRKDFVARFVNEAKLVSNLIHTHIVQIYLLGATGDEDSRLDAFIAMEFVNGINLRGLIDRHISDGKLMSVDIAVYVASRVARALEYAHLATDRTGRPLGIVHRDISPQNVLISLEGVVKLSDFGIAKAVTYDAASVDYVAGKKKYMAPEQAQPFNVNFRADIFSLGFILYEMLTNCLPARGVPVTVSDLRPEVPCEIDAIIATATQTNPAERFSTTTEMAVALERAIYEKGYGPTFVTMAEYLKEIFPLLEIEMPKAAAEDLTVFHHRKNQ